MTFFPTGRLALVVLVMTLPLVAAGCQSAPRSRADAATTAACRAQADRVYAAQNRVELSQRDQRDTPFASNYVSGITSRGLGARFGLDNQISSCISNSTAPGKGGSSTNIGTGPTFSPAAR